MTTNLPAGVPPPTRLASLQARLRSWRLDHELAAGAIPCSDRVLLARAVDLTGPRLRAETAEGLECIARGAARPPRPRDAIWTVHAPTARAAAPALLALAARLRSAEPVGARGVALIRCLVIDGSGPLHTGDLDGLRAALQEIDAALLPS